MGHNKQQKREAFWDYSPKNKKKQTNPESFPAIILILFFIIFAVAIEHNEKSSGLALTLSKEFVEKHKDKIWFESEVNKWTTFFFSIPDVG